MLGKNLIAVQGICRDISEKVYLEERLSHLTETKI
jgi:hypothetical protein